MYKRKIWSFLLFAVVGTFLLYEAKLNWDKYNDKKDIKEIECVVDYVTEYNDYYTVFYNFTLNDVTYSDAQMVKEVTDDCMIYYDSKNIAKNSFNKDDLNNLSVMEFYLRLFFYFILLIVSMCLSCLCCCATPKCKVGLGIVENKRRRREEDL